METIFFIFVIALEQDIAQSATKNTHGLARLHRKLSNIDYILTNKYPIEYIDNEIKLVHLFTIFKLFLEKLIFKIVFFFHLNQPQLIMKSGYNAEIHFVTTEGGYILEMHRLCKDNSSFKEKRRKVCFFMHGLVFSSACYVISGQNHALGRY